MKAHPGAFARLHVPGQAWDDPQDCDTKGHRALAIPTSAPGSHCQSLLWTIKAQQAEPVNTRMVHSPTPPAPSRPKRFATDDDGNPSGGMKMRRTGLGISFPSVSDLTTFAGSTGSTPGATEGCLRKSKSLPAMNHDVDPPWRRFERWKANNPGASRLECRQYIQKTLRSEVL